MAEPASVKIEQSIAAPPERVAAFIGDFRNAREWMVGVEAVEQLGEDSYRLRLDTPVGKVEPQVRLVEHNRETVRWVYTSAVEGGGQVDVSPDGDGGSRVSYAGEFRLKQRLLGRLAKAAGMERFARKNGERSLARLKAYMEAHRSGP